MISLNLSVNYSPIREAEEYIEFDVLAISTAPIKRPIGIIQFPEEVLKESFKSLIGKPVLIDHKYSVESIIGSVVFAEYSEEKKGIVARVRIPKVGHERIISLLKMEPSPIQDVSVGVVVETEKVDDIYRVVKAYFKELSLVLEGADRNAKRLSKNYENWWDDPELRQKAPTDFFLDPSTRRYPYKSWDGEISCERLKAAMQLSSLHGHRQIYERARSLYNKHCKEE